MRLAKCLTGVINEETLRVHKHPSVGKQKAKLERVPKAQDIVVKAMTKRISSKPQMSLCSNTQTHAFFPRD